MIITGHNSKKELHDFLYKNSRKLIRQKKATLKEADGVGLFAISNNSIDISDENKPVDKGLLIPKPLNDPDDVINATLIINTTNIIDSHKDLHLPNLWKKSLQESSDLIQHLQEHKRDFSKVIAEDSDLKVFTKYFNWSELGQSYPGKTQALVFDSKIKKERNEFMWRQYAKGYVKNHSVGMQYVTLMMAIDNKNYPENYEIFKKYIDKAVNPEVIGEDGYFWVVPEAKVIEGSAVTRGSNFVTPTMNMKSEPGDAHSESDIDEPGESHSLSKQFLINLLTK